MPNIVLALILLITAGVGETGTPNSDPIGPTLTPEITFVNATPQQEATVLAAIADFVEADLPLPPLEVTFGEYPTGCKGNKGWFQPAPADNPAAPDRIEICNSWEFFLYHEIAHAWEHHSATDKTRDLVVDYWGLESWSSHDHEWGDRGIEKAASTVAYVLAFDAIPEDLNTDLYLCSYEIVTGSPLPAAISADCNG
ncbi:MAG: hypothetical protein ACR2PK_15775 [Acidimicrobiales bacterium]